MRQRLSRIRTLRPSSPVGVLLSGAGLLGLLALVAAASRAHHTPGGHPGIHQPPAGVGNYVFSILAVVFVGMFLFLLYLWFSERDLLVQSRLQRKRGPYKVILFVVVVALLASLATRLFPDFVRHRQEEARQRIHPGAASKQKHKPIKGHFNPRPPEFQWIPVFVATAAGMVLLGFIGLRAMRRARNELVAAHRLEQAFEALLDDTLADLYAEQDPRAAIIKAYGRMEQVFGSYGLPRERSEAPMEYLERALGELRASGSSLRRLTMLFQWAKFSDHEVASWMRDDAIKALVTVRDELHANRLWDEQRDEEARRLREKLAASQGKDEREWGENPFTGLKEQAKGNIYGRRGI
jgi:hypothetical protein